MLAVGRNPATARHLDQQVSFVEGNAESAGVSEPRL